MYLVSVVDHITGQHPFTVQREDRADAAAACVELIAMAMLINPDYEVGEREATEHFIVQAINTAEGELALSFMVNDMDSLPELFEAASARS